MNLYHFSDPLDFRFARASRIGTWSPSPGVCPECGRSRSIRISPLIIEWLPDSDKIGDFTWPGINDEIVVSQNLRDSLEVNFRGFKFLAIDMHLNPKLKRPQKITKRTKPRVWLPYEGPPLWELKPTSWCKLDHNRSGVMLDRVCNTCGRPKYIHPAFEERHLVLDRTTWAGEDIFYIQEYAGWVFCTEEVKVFIERKGFTNAGFSLDGEIPD